jgi:hypothetical protein
VGGRENWGLQEASLTPINRTKRDPTVSRWAETTDHVLVGRLPHFRRFSSFSTLHCLAVSMQDGGAGTGTVMRGGTVRD